MSLVHHTEREMLYLLDLSRDLKRLKYSGAPATSRARTSR
jgi:ornithine carbamoyltransferase